MNRYANKDAPDLPLDPRLLDPRAIEGLRLLIARAPFRVTEVEMFVDACEAAAGGYEQPLRAILQRWFSE
jgi:hypothetical protein